VTIVNRAASVSELGETVTAELCDVFDAEIAFVLATGDDGGCDVVGAYGIKAFELLDSDLCGGSVASTVPRVLQGEDLLSVGVRNLVLVPFDAGTGVVGVGRLYESPFDEAEVALLEAIVQSTEHALQRIRLSEERDRLLRDADERGHAARVLGSVADGVFLVDASGVVRLWNRAAEVITGLASDAVLGRPVDDAIPGWRDVGKSVVLARAPADAGSRAVTLPIEIDGRELWLSVAGVGFAEGAVYAFRDLTEERRLEQLKTDFIATVSHELRTPIAAVHGAAKTLERSDIAFSDEARSHLLAIISEQSERLVAIVNDILLASQVDRREVRLTTESVDASELARRVIESAKSHAPSGLTLALTAPPSVPPVVADRDKLRQVLGNLVGNAVKYSPDGGRVELRLEPRESHLCFIVRDEGLGIAEQEIGRIFEKFYRVDPNMTRGVSGSGLGLYICRELVRRMGGTIGVESKLGSGSTFSVLMPLA
jgi:two-component system phosphate regulon sensor histidine kinase PhoR